VRGTGCSCCSLVGRGAFAVSAGRERNPGLTRREVGVAPDVEHSFDRVPTYERVTGTEDGTE